MFALICASLFAQKRDANYSLQTNPVSVLGELLLLRSGDPLIYLDINSEFALQNKISIAVSTALLVVPLGGIFGMYSLSPAFVYYPAGVRMSGWFISGTLYFTYYGIPDISAPGETSEFERQIEEFFPSVQDMWHGESSKTFTVGIGAGTGYKWIWDNGFTMTLGFNFGKSYASNVLAAFLPTPDWWIHLGAIDIKPVLLIGYSF